MLNYTIANFRLGDLIVYEIDKISEHVQYREYQRVGRTRVFKFY